MSKKLAAGEIDAYIAWEPFDAQAVIGGQGRYLIQSQDIWPDHPCCVLATAQASQDPGVLDALVWAHVKATDFINNPDNREKVVQYAQEFTGQDRAVVIESLTHIAFVQYPNREQFLTYYADLKKSGLLSRSSAALGYREEKQFLADFLDQDVYDRVKAKLANDPAWVPAPVPEKVKLVMGYICRDLHQLAVYVSQQEGYFEAVGLSKGKNLEISECANGVAVMQAFKVKELNVSYMGAAPAMMKRINDDIRIRIIAGANNNGSSIVVGKNSLIRSVKDLAGKTVAVPAVGTVQYFVLEMALTRVGLQSVLE